MGEDWERDVSRGAKYILEETWVKANDPHYDAKFYSHLQGGGASNASASGAGAGDEEETDLAALASLKANKRPAAAEPAPRRRRRWAAGTLRRRRWAAGTLRLQVGGSSSSSSNS